MLKSSPWLAIYDKFLVYLFFLMSSYSFSIMVLYGADQGVFQNFRWYWRITNISSLLLAFSFRKELWNLIKKEPFSAVFILYLIGTVFWSVDPATTAKKSYSLLANYCLALYFVYRFSFRERFLLVKNVLCLIAILSFIAAVFFPFIGVMHDPTHVGAWSGILPHKNHLGRLMVFALIYVVLDDRAFGIKKAFAPVMIFLISLLLLFSCSASSFVACLVVLMILGLGLVFKPHQPKSYSIICIAVVIFSIALNMIVTRHEVQIGFIIDKIKSSYAQKAASHASLDKQEIGFVGGWQSVMETLTSTHFDELPVSKSSKKNDGSGAYQLLDREKNMTGRLDFWPILIEATFNKPFIGYGYYGFWSPKNPEYQKIIDAFYWKELSHAHNAFIDLVLDAGILGLILFLMSFIVAIRNAARFFHRQSSQIALFPMSLLTAYIMTNLGESGAFWVNRIDLPLYLMLTYGLVCSQGNHLDKNADKIKR